MPKLHIRISILCGLLFGVLIALSSGLQAQSTPVLNVNPSELRLELQEGDNNPDSPSITISNDGGGQMKYLFSV